MRSALSTPCRPTRRSSASAPTSSRARSWRPIAAPSSRCRLAPRTVGWWSPDPRGVLELDDLRVSRSLRAACRRFEIRVDTAYDEVIRACADPKRPSGWIRRDVIEAYARLHELGWVHSVEAWSVDPGGRERLAGGLYGVSIGGLFAGESMFHHEPDASKVALVALVDMLRAARAQDHAPLRRSVAAGRPGGCWTCNGPPTTSCPWVRRRSAGATICPAAGGPAVAAGAARLSASGGRPSRPSRRTRQKSPPSPSAERGVWSRVLLASTATG